MPPQGQEWVFETLRRLLDLNASRSAPKLPASPKAPADGVQGVPTKVSRSLRTPCVIHWVK